MEFRPKSTFGYRTTKNSNSIRCFNNFESEKLQIISIVNKGINMILFSIDINVEQISDLNELLELSMNNFKKKISLVKEIDKDYEKNLKTIEDLNLQKSTVTRKNKEKSEKLLNFIVTELNKKKKNNMTLNEQINTLFAGEEKKKNENEIINEENKKDVPGDVEFSLNVISDLTYSNIWNSFTKWCIDQTELGYIVNIFSFGNMFYVSEKQNEGISVKLTDFFLREHNLKWDETKSTYESLYRNKYENTKPQTEKLNYN